MAPLRYGAGIKGKVNMSMSRGQPVVATPMAVEGMFATIGQGCAGCRNRRGVCRRRLSAFTRMRDLWNQVSLAGLENVRQYFSLETARLSLQALLNSLH